MQMDIITQQQNKNKYKEDENVSFCVKPGEKLTALAEQAIDSNWNDKHRVLTFATVVVKYWSKYYALCLGVKGRKVVEKRVAR